MAILTSKSILAADDIQKELVSIPEWGGEVWVYGLTAAETGNYRKSIVDQTSVNPTLNLRDIQVKLCVMAMRDENGKRLFVGPEAERELSQKSEAAMARVYDVAQRLSGLSDESVKELAQGLREDPLEDSPSD